MNFHILGIAETSYKCGFQPMTLKAASMASSLLSAVLGLGLNVETQQ